jgi:hypothetical protein
MQLRFGAGVIDADGERSGRLSRVLIDSGTREVSHVVVQRRDTRAEVVVPWSLLQGSIGSRLLLHVSLAGLTGLPVYEADRDGLAAAHRVDIESALGSLDQLANLEAALALSGRTLELSWGMPVVTLDTVHGELVGVAAEEPTAQLTELVVRVDHEQRVIIHAPWIGELRPGSITVSTTVDQLRSLPAPAAGAFVPMRSGPRRRVVERVPAQ